MNKKFIDGRVGSSDSEIRIETTELHANKI